MNRNKIKKHLTAFLWMIVGSTVVLSSVVIMNSFVEGPQKDEIEKTTYFEPVKEKPKKKPKIEKKKRRKKRRSVSSARKTLAPDLSGISGGFDFGLPEFQPVDTGGISKSVLGEIKDVVMTQESVDVKPVAVNRVAAEYPKRARARGITGYVVFNILISKTGGIEKLKILESNPSGVFDEVAKEAVEQWRFEPARYQGKAVKVWAKQRVSFKLD